MTNGFNPYRVTKDNRRACIIAVGNHEKQNALYFIEMKKQVLDNIDGLRGYFKALPIPKDLNAIRPKTSKELELLELNKSSAETFIESKMNLDNDNKLSNVYLEYKLYNHSRGLKGCLDERYFVCCLNGYGYSIDTLDESEIVVKPVLDISDDDMKNVKAVQNFIDTQLNKMYPEVHFVIYDTSEGGKKKLVIEKE